MKRILLVLAVYCHGCGDQSGPEEAKAATPPPTPGLPADTAAPMPPAAKHSLYVATTAALPACDVAGEGWLVYVQEEAAFKACLAGAWSPVDIKGEKGDAGAAGEKGADGTSNVIAESVYCGGVFDGTTLHGSLSVSTMTSGDVFVSGAVAGAISQSSATRYFRAGAPGAETPAVTITMDVGGSPNAGFWILAYNREQKILGAIYNDADLAEPKTFTLPTEKCEVVGP